MCDNIILVVCGEGEEHSERYQYRGDLLARGNSIMIRGNTAARSSSQEHQPSERGWWFTCAFMIRGYGS